MATTAEPWILTAWKNRVSASESEGARKFTRGDGGNAENPPVGREVTRRELRQGLKGMAPRQAGAERMQEGVESRWVLARWQVPEYARGR